MSEQNFWTLNKSLNFWFCLFSMLDRKEIDKLYLTGKFCYRLINEIPVKSWQFAEFNSNCSINNGNECLKAFKYFINSKRFSLLYYIGFENNKMPSLHYDIYRQFFIQLFNKNLKGLYLKGIFTSFIPDQVLIKLIDSNPIEYLFIDSISVSGYYQLLFKIINCLENQNRLKKLSIHGMWIEHLLHLEHLIYSIKLEYLSLKENIFGNHDDFLIFHNIQNNSSLKILHISDNIFG